MSRAMRVSHVPFRVWDRDAAQKFFIDVLGFELHPRGAITYVRLGEVLMELLSAEEPEDPTTVPYVFGVEVEDLDAAFASALASGASVVRPPVERGLVLGTPSGDRRPGWAADGASSVRGARRTDLCRVVPAKI